MILLNQLQLYAKQILNDYDKKKPSVLFKNNINITVADAYKIQSLVTELRIKRGEKVIGYKIGSVQKQTQKKYGLSHPAWGRLWENELHFNGAQLNKNNYSNPAMEAEFGIKLKRNLNPENISLEYILDSIETIHPIIEIHNLIFYGEKPHGDITKVNEIVINKGVKIMGESNILNKLPVSASNLYSKNTFNFINNLFDKEKKDFDINLEDEIIEKTLIK